MCRWLGGMREWMQAGSERSAVGTVEGSDMSDATCYSCVKC